MNAVDIIGCAYNAATYCVEHKPRPGCKDRQCQDSECCPQPIFASGEVNINDDGTIDDCDTCFLERIHQRNPY